LLRAYLENHSARIDSLAPPVFRAQVAFMFGDKVVTAGNDVLKSKRSVGVRRCVLVLFGVVDDSRRIAWRFKAADAIPIVCAA
jgi:hypothetical protein